ncbi:MAG: dienelactone hydrolase family protein [Acidimicrobiales bacterium]
MPGITFRDHDVTAKGVRERRIDVAGRRGETVPAMLWTPEDASGPRPLVLIGHGVTGTKQEAHVVALARIVARRHAMAALAIDGPIHGDRRADVIDGNQAFIEFGQRWHRDPDLIDDMISDWRSSIDAVQELDEIGVGPVGYWGLSMGTILGLPLVAAEARIEVAVLGLMGVTGPNPDRLLSEASALAVPVLFIVQWDDVLFPPSVSLPLFEAIGTRDKRLHANPGAHSAVPTEEFLASAEFMATHLAPAGRADARV